MTVSVQTGQPNKPVLAGGWLPATTGSFSERAPWPATLQITSFQNARMKLIKLLIRLSMALDFFAASDAQITMRISISVA